MFLTQKTDKAKISRLIKRKFKKPHHNRKFY